MLSVFRRGTQSVSSLAVPAPTLGLLAPSVQFPSLYPRPAPLPGQCWLAVRWKTKKSAGSRSKSKKSPPGKRLGVKLWNHQEAKPGMMIVKQRGMRWRPGQNVGMGRDHSIYALNDGKVHFRKERVQIPYRGTQWRTFVHVVPDGDDVKFYSPRRSIRNTWTNPCPLNLKWDLVASSRENVECAIEMLERDRQLKKEKNYEKAPQMLEEKLSELREMLQSNTFRPLESTDGSAEEDAPESKVSEAATA